MLLSREPKFSFQFLYCPKGALSSRDNYPWFIDSPFIRLIVY